MHERIRSQVVGGAGVSPRERRGYAYILYRLGRRHEFTLPAAAGASRRQKTKIIRNFVRVQSANASRDVGREGDLFVSVQKRHCSV